VRTTVTPPTGPPQVTDYLVDTTGPLSHVIAETTATGALQALYVRADDDLIALLRPDATTPGALATRHYHADAIGSIRALTDEAGAVTDEYDYTAFGELRSHEGDDPQPYAFTGEPRDPNTTWQHHRARWLDPIAGRFVGVDPFAGRRCDPPSLHKYLYAAADPANKVDPSGRFFNSSDLISALSSLQILARIALPQIGAALEALAPLYFASLKVIFWADVGLTTAGAAATVGGAILDNMASRLEATNTSFPPGNSPRGLELGRLAGRNLADNFPKIDDFDFDQGAATSIKSTTQVRSQARLVNLLAGYAGEFDTIDRDLVGYDSAGRLVRIVPNAIKVRSLLMAVPPLEPQVARGLSGQLAQVARVMGVNIRLVQIGGLRP
jgi:RHS repeat-associated protein